MLTIYPSESQDASLCENIHMVVILIQTKRSYNPLKVTGTRD